MFYTLTVNKKRPYPECTHLDGIEQTQIPTRWVVEGRLPLRETLKTVHHTAIVTSGRRGNETTDDVTTLKKMQFLSDVQKDNPRIEHNESAKTWVNTTRRDSTMWC